MKINLLSDPDANPAARCDELIRSINDGILNRGGRGAHGGAQLVEVGDGIFVSTDDGAVIVQQQQPRKRPLVNGSDLVKFLYKYGHWPSDAERKGNY